MEHNFIPTIYENVELCLNCGTVKSGDPAIKLSTPCDAWKDYPLITKPE